MIRWLQFRAKRLLRRYLRLNLSERVAGAMLALVTFAAVLVAVLAHFAGERLEENVNYDLLAEELTHYEQRLRVDPGAAPLMSASLHIYRSVNLNELPREIVRLRPGIHRTIRRDGRSFRVLVRDGEFGRMYITYDVTEHERGQRIALIVLIAGVLGTLALTTWAAFRISRPLLGPVHQLARQLSQIDPRERRIRIAGDFTGNELEPIARSIDTFLERLDGFVEREQAFTATASHELRTPLAVIQGAVELIAEQYAQQDGRHSSAEKALARIQRAVREMSEFTTALLSLARETQGKHGSDARCDVGQLLRRIVEEQQLLAHDKQIQLESDDALRVAAPDSMVAMVIGNVVRNAIQHGVGTQISCVLKGGMLQVGNGGQIAAGDLPNIFKPRYTTRSSGHGMGLYLAQRICERYRWNLRIDSEGGGTTTVIDFNAATADGDVRIEATERAASVDSGLETRDSAIVIRDS
jgi:signal transduction histidine kinase